MAVPKKRTSKSKTRSRKSNWKRKAFYASKQAISLAKSIFTAKSNSYVYLSKDVNSDSETNS
nr:50S ribosomal protein L32 [Corallina ferreyrae]YP_009660528.1 50S ribosomal protein L32 [Corallina chilensis]QBL75576.1 50S ribosomal protein L32 [Corallina ferreyrae]QCS25476.1 50S ribosomal protein L32 [Corallina chilensis]